MIRKVISYKLWVMGLITLLTCNSSLITHHYCFAQDNSTLVNLTKQIMEAKNNEELYVSFEELKDLYFSENKYNEFADFLNSLLKQNKTLEPVTKYYIALSRYHQLKYLEETQGWDEYFSQGNTYRAELLGSVQKTVDALTEADVLNIYARLLIWKFYLNQQDTTSESTLSDLMNSTFAYAQHATNLVPIKDVADELSFYGEKLKAKVLYRAYVNKLIASDIKDEALNRTALGFYKEGNLDLAEGIYDAYIDRISPSMPPEKSILLLLEVAKLFSFKDKEPSDALYAERVFRKIDDIGGKDVFSEEILYLRAFNLEKAKEYKNAKDVYRELIQRYPQTNHNDEANFKLGIIYTYILRDIKSGRTYFEKLSQKEPSSPRVISSLYQLGLLSQWEEDFIKAKEYYNKLLSKAAETTEDFNETVTKALERLKELEETKPMEYNLKTFLDVSLKEEYILADMTKLDLQAHPYQAKKDEQININSTAYTAESGCMQVELQYLWSGHLGETIPSLNEPSFNTTYSQTGTKEINLVVVSPASIIDRNIDLVDVY